MNEGLIGYSSGTGFTSKLIKWVTGGWCSHSFPIWKYGEKYFTLDAQENGIVLHTLNHYRSKNRRLEIRSFPCDEQKQKEFVEKLFTMADMDYDYGYGQFSGMLLVEFMEKLGRNVKNKFTKNYICSELSYLYMLNCIPKDNEPLIQSLCEFNQDNIDPWDLNQVQTKSDVCFLRAASPYGQEDIIWLYE